jgi:hypothetical protein
LSGGGVCGTLKAKRLRGACVNDDLTRWEVVWGGAVGLGLHTALTALALVAVLTALWAGVVAVLAGIVLILVAPPFFSWLGERHPAWSPLFGAYQRLTLVYALVMGFAVGTLGLTVLLGAVRSYGFGEEVQVRGLLFAVVQVVYMITVSLPGLLLLLAVPAWMVGLVDPWWLRFLLGFAGFGAAAVGAVVMIFGPVQLVSNVMGRPGSSGAEGADVSAPLLFWSFYGLVTLLSVLTALAFSRWEGLRPPSRRSN